MIKNLLVLLLFLSGYSSLNAQSRIGSWRSYLPYTEASNVAIADNRIYCSTSGGLFYFNKADNSINKLSREDGLSDTQISAIEYSETDNALIIAYQTSIIDIIRNNKIISLPDIQRNQIPGDKAVYSINFHNNLAYLSTGFGIVELDVANDQFGDTWIIGSGGRRIKVYETAFLDNHIYAATEEGIYRANLNSPNLVDFNYWERLTNIPGFSGTFHTITSVHDKIYISSRGGGGAKDIVYSGDGSTWSVFSGFTGEICRQLTSSDDRLILVDEHKVVVYNEHGNLIRELTTGSPQSATMNSLGELYIADLNRGLLRNLEGTTVTDIVPDGPGSLFVTDVAVASGKFYVVPGGPRADFNNNFRRAEIYQNTDNRWSNQNYDEFRDFFRIKLDPRNPERYFVATWGWGLVEFLNGEVVNVFNTENSSLQTIIPGNYIRIAGLAFDSDNNLWMTNVTDNLIPNAVSVLTSDGEWVGFPIVQQINAPIMGNIIATSLNHKWMLLPRSNGIFVLDDNRTPDDFSDDRYKKLSVVDNTNSIISNDVRSIAEDHNGHIWIGTNKGVLVYYNPGRVFDDAVFFAQQINISRRDGSGFGDYLLGTETVTAIAVDGGNRKWLGTSAAGVFLVSPDGQEEIHSFNTENSPLLSNTILNITIDDYTGEVFIGTDKGLISYKSDATAPGNVFSDVYVYPNPVRHDYHGDIVISGLVAETIVKITDINGNIVYETTSLGGQAVWNGNNFSGDRVKTGVYLVFCSDRDGNLSAVTKLLFIN